MDVQGIIILGMHRGGTSLAAQLAARWGAYGDQHAMVPPDAGNPEGYWEFAPLVSFNDEILRAVESRWNVPPGDNHKELLHALAQETHFRDRAFQLLETMRVQGRPWFWKDPRLSILLPFWQQLWGPVAYVIAIRDPSDIALSLNKRNGLSTLTSFLLWQRYLTEIMVDKEVRREAVFVSYDLLLKHPREECTKLCRFLDGRFGAPLGDQQFRTESMVSAVLPDLYTSRARPFLENPLATSAQKALYRSALSQAKKLFQHGPGSAILDPAWREQLTLADHFVKAAMPDVCQMFWRSPNDSYDELRSTWALIRAQTQLQSIPLSFPPNQGKELIFLRVDFSRRPGLLHLVDFAVKNTAGEVIWDWNGRPEVLAGLIHNQLEISREPMLPHGCLLRMNGDDPWIEIALDNSQSDSAANGGTLIVGAQYLSTEQALLMIRSEFILGIGASIVKK